MWPRARPGRPAVGRQEASVVFPEGGFGQGPGRCESALAPPPASLNCETTLGWCSPPPHRGPFSSRGCRISPIEWMRKLRSRWGHVGSEPCLASTSGHTSVTLENVSTSEEGTTVPHPLCVVDKVRVGPQTLPCVSLAGRLSVPEHRPHVHASSYHSLEPSDVPPVADAGMCSWHLAWKMNRLQWSLPLPFDLCFFRK